MKKRNRTRENTSNETEPSKRKSQNRRKFFKRGGDERKGIENSDKLSSLNDISWYSRYPDLLNAAASIPYPYRPGQTFISGSHQYTIPGVLRIDWAPSIGPAAQATDPVNIAAKEIYAKVRSVFSGSLEADPPDFVMYVMALDSIFSYIGALKRIYRILTAYTPQNHLLPETLLVTMGFTKEEISTLQTNLPIFYSNINQLVYSTRKLAMPQVMDLFNRHYWMNDNVYADAESLNSQLFVFVQQVFYSFVLLPTTNNASIKAGGLCYTPAPWSAKDNDVDFGATYKAVYGNGSKAEVIDLGWSTTDDIITQLFKCGNTMINRLAQWDDSYTISGYLMRAYQDANHFSVDELQGNEIFTPVYVPEVLSQIENAKQLGPANPFMYHITNEYVFSRLINVVQQDTSTNTVQFSPIIGASGTSLDEAFASDFLGTEFISIRDDNPTVAQTVIATRLHSSIYSGKVGDGYRICSGTEIVLSMSITNPTLTNEPGDTLFYGQMINTETIGDDNGNYIIAMAQGAQFDWNPLSMLISNTTWTYLGDVHNITKISTEQLQRIHNVCIYSELNAYNQ